VIVVVMVMMAVVVAPSAVMTMVSMMAVAAVSVMARRGLCVGRQKGDASGQGCECEDGFHRTSSSSFASGGCSGRLRNHPATAAFPWSSLKLSKLKAKPMFDGRKKCRSLQLTAR